MCTEKKIILYEQKLDWSLERTLINGMRASVQQTCSHGTW